MTPPSVVRVTTRSAPLARGARIETTIGKSRSGSTGVGFLRMCGDRPLVAFIEWLGGGGLCLV